MKETRAGRAHTPAPPAFPAAGWLLYLLGLTVCMSSQRIAKGWCLGTIQEHWDASRGSFCFMGDTIICELANPTANRTACLILAVMACRVQIDQ